MTALLLVVAALLALALAALCAGAETGYLSVSRERILHLAREGGRKAALVQRALRDMSRTTTMLLIGNNLASVSYSASTAALSAALRDGVSYTDDCGAVEALGVHTYLCRGSEENIKITTPADLPWAEAILNSRRGTYQ